MRCLNCGADLPENEWRCPYCGHTIQMVPDYNPLEEVVTSEVRSSLTANFEAVERERRRPTEPNRRPDTNARDVSNRRPVANVKEPNRRPEVDPREAAARRRRQAERNRAIKRKKRNLAIILVVSCVLLLTILTVLIQRNSYSGLINRGNKAAEDHSITEAVTLYEKAINKKPGKSEAYIVLSNMYYEEDEWQKAEEILLQGALENPDNEELHTAVVHFYQETGQEDKVMEFYNQCSDKMKKALDAYNSEAPSFSLKSGSYDDVQELTLKSNGDKIYYTEDGTVPTKDSIQYGDPIQLKEGTTVITAISYNAEGVPSTLSSAEYEIILPIEGAPIVNPSTGQYKEATQIVVTVPEGYEAFYTMDGSTPSAESTKYTEAIDMPEGNTIFSAILINASGKSSDITKRNYSLVIEDESED